MAHWRSLYGVVKTFKNWPTHVLDHLRLIPPGVMHYELRNGVRFNARSRTMDSMAIREVWIFNDYAPAGMEIDRDAVVVDIGGHIGCFAVLAARRASGGKVYVFEPIAENFALLEQNLELNSISNVTGFNMAVASTGGTRQMALYDNQVSHSLVFGQTGLRHAEVQCISLADFAKQQNLQRIDFLKLDCEGAEFEILFQCPDEVMAMIQKISAEVHDHDERNNRVRLGKFLETKGFRVELDPIRRQMLHARRGSFDDTGRIITLLGSLLSGVGRGA